MMLSTGNAVSGQDSEAAVSSTRSMTVLRKVGSSIDHLPSSSKAPRSSRACRSSAALAYILGQCQATIVSLVPFLHL